MAMHIVFLLRKYLLFNTSNVIVREYFTESFTNILKQKGKIMHEAKIKKHFQTFQEYFKKTLHINKVTVDVKVKLDREKKVEVPGIDPSTYRMSK